MDNSRKRGKSGGDVENARIGLEGDRRPAEGLRVAKVADTRLQSI